MRCPNLEEFPVTDAEIEKKVIELVAQNLNQEADAITKDSSFTNDLNADGQATDFIKSAMHAKAGG